MDNETESSPLSPAILRGLGDRSYEKRKAAALEVTSVIKSLFEVGEYDRITSVLQLLAQDFARSRNSHHRKGGLIGLAASAIGLVGDIHRYLPFLIPPVLECFDDPESRVCYYACESMYNISKVARAYVLEYFNQIFDGLCKLFAHVDNDVKNGANLLDRLIKDIVTESESFDIEAFIPLLQKHIRRTKPYIRQLIISWIAVLNTVSDINMLDYLPDILEGLFHMIADSNKDIQQLAINLLNEFLNELKNAEIIEFTPIIKILINLCQSLERDIRMMGLIWIYEFLLLGDTKLVHLYPGLLKIIMFNISDPDNDIRQQTQLVHMKLLILIKSTTVSFDLVQLLHIVVQDLLSPHISSRMTSLQWINMLVEIQSFEINKYVKDLLLPSMMKLISDTADEVILMNLNVLARIALDKIQFYTILNELLVLFYHDRPLLESRGALVIRKLCVLLDAKSIYIAMSLLLKDMTDYDYISLMIQILNLILLTAPELYALRQVLSQCNQSVANPDSSVPNTLNTTTTSSSSSTISPSILNLPLNNITMSSDTTTLSDYDVFITLFRTWCYNPTAMISLCLLSQMYALSSALILSFIDIDLSIGFFMQMDKLIQLIESPVFIRLRLQLLEPTSSSQMELLKTLYGILMLLPQSYAYKILSERVSTASSLHMHIGFASTYIQQRQYQQHHHLVNTSNVNISDTNKYNGNTDISQVNISPPIVTSSPSPSTSILGSFDTSKFFNPLRATTPTNSTTSSNTTTTTTTTVTAANMSSNSGTVITPRPMVSTSSKNISMNTNNNYNTPSNAQELTINTNNNATTNTMSNTINTQSEKMLTSSEINLLVNETLVKEFIYIQKKHTQFRQHIMLDKSLTTFHPQSTTTTIPETNSNSSNHHGQVDSTRTAVSADKYNTDSTIIFPTITTSSTPSSSSHITTSYDKSTGHLSPYKSSDTTTTTNATNTTTTATATINNNNINIREPYRHTSPLSARNERNTTSITSNVSPRTMTIISPQPQIISKNNSHDNDNDMNATEDRESYVSV